MHSFSNLSVTAQAVLKAAQTMDATVLITGATGTGKSFLAEKIHAADSRRRRHRFVKVNLATLSEGLIESELFGHEKGAFTGAEIRRAGKLENADGGTVFLDEVGELSPRLQSKLLDFIQYKKVTPVGSNHEVRIDVRIVAATNKNLEAAVRAGVFREDLFHRLNVFRVHLSDLATMPQTALDLASEMLRDKAAFAGKEILFLAQDLKSAIWRYSWPGNIRELENAIEFAVAMETTDELTLNSMPSNFKDWIVEQERYSREMGLSRPLGLAVSEEQNSLADPACVLELPVSLNYRESKRSFERRYIEFALKSCDGQINLTSRRTGLNKTSLVGKARCYGIDWKQMRRDAVSTQVVVAAQMQAKAESTSVTGMSFMQS